MQCQKIIISVAFVLLAHLANGQNYGNQLACYILNSVDTIDYLYKKRLSSKIIYKKSLVTSSSGESYTSEYFDKKRHGIADLLKSDSTEFLNDSLFCYPISDTVIVIDSLGIYDSLTYVSHNNYTCIVVPYSLKRQYNYKNYTTLVLLRVNTLIRRLEIVFSYLSEPNLVLELDFYAQYNESVKRCWQIQQYYRRPAK
jgi:hypothetical protein